MDYKDLVVIASAFLGGTFGGTVGGPLGVGAGIVVGAGVSAVWAYETDLRKYTGNVANRRENDR
ncbi:hypothetical protein [Natronosalvus halobius]|uniref:hypothetical protein n=1 Tax=Natronosalvus halobius TaxID=2953746 RepID=UPI00209FC16B|nr:hypothetical protein [Natronosalvus halobius]USZ71106.1 hypothetical protein NGM15_13575 [Natronosalvus halobius]